MFTPSPTNFISWIVIVVIAALAILFIGGATLLIGYLAIGLIGYLIPVALFVAGGYLWIAKNKMKEGAALVLIGVTMFYLVYFLG